MVTYKVEDNKWFEYDLCAFHGADPCDGWPQLNGTHVSGPAPGEVDWEYMYIHFNWSHPSTYGGSFVWLTRITEDNTIPYSFYDGKLERPTYAYIEEFYYQLCNSTPGCIMTMYGPWWNMLTPLRTALTAFSVPSIEHYQPLLGGGTGLPFWTGADQTGYFGLGSVTTTADPDGFEYVEQPNQLGCEGCWGKMWVYFGYNDTHQGHVEMAIDGGCYLRAGTYIYKAKSWSKSGTIDHFGKTHDEKMLALAGKCSVKIHDIGNVNSSAIVAGEITYEDLDVVNSYLSAGTWEAGELDTVEQVSYRIDEAGDVIETKREVKNVTTKPFLIDKSCCWFSTPPQANTARVVSSSLTFSDTGGIGFEELEFFNYYGTCTESNKVQANNLRVTNIVGNVNLQTTGGSEARIDFNVQCDSEQITNLTVGININGDANPDYWYKVNLINCTFIGDMTIIIDSGITESTRNDWFQRDENEVLPAAGQTSGWYKTGPLQFNVVNIVFDPAVPGAPNQSWSGNTCTYTGFTNDVIKDKTPKDYGIPTNYLYGIAVPSLVGNSSLGSKVTKTVNYDKLFSGSGATVTKGNGAVPYKFYEEDDTGIPGPACKQ